MSYKLPTDPSKAAEVARSNNLSGEQLEALAASDLPFLREAAAAHPRSTSQLLLTLLPAELSSEVGQRIARALSTNPSTPPQALQRLCDLLDSTLVDGSHRENQVLQDLAVRVLRHHSCPELAGLELIERASRDLRIRVAKEVVNRNFLDRLARDASGTVAEFAQHRLSGDGA